MRVHCSKTHPRCPNFRRLRRAERKRYFTNSIVQFIAKKCGGLFTIVFASTGISGIPWILPPPSAGENLGGLVHFLDFTLPPVSQHFRNKGGVGVKSKGIGGLSNAIPTYDVLDRRFGIVLCRNNAKMVCALKAVRFANVLLTI